MAFDYGSGSFIITSPLTTLFPSNALNEETARKYNIQIYISEF